MYENENHLAILSKKFSKKSKLVFKINDGALQWYNIN